MEIPPFFDGQNSTASRLQLPRWQVRQTLSIQGSQQYPCHKRFATNGAVKSVYVLQIISQIERSLFHFKIDEEKTNQPAGGYSATQRKAFRSAARPKICQTFKNKSAN
jgi:hypothetical protein